MRPLFVRYSGGHRDIAWIKLLMSSALVIVLTGAAFEGAWYLITGHAGLGALVASLVPSTLTVSRLIAGTLAFQDQECPEEPSVGPA
ncbi:hypothetical protein [Aquisphaera insulae]|uniref:hypothetical protein n=1 Tax=Aquisphaera insulae TaxID=2712864 RepID=UPI0013EA85A6|nr:hypothetical protein [Aquisphaera insulae]